MGYLVVVHACVPPTQALNFLYIIYFLPIFFALDENATMALEEGSGKV